MEENIEFSKEWYVDVLKKNAQYILENAEYIIGDYQNKSGIEVKITMGYGELTTLETKDNYVVTEKSLRGDI